VPVTPVHRTVAVDWSGAREPGRPSRIWLAEVADGTLVRLHGGWSRAEVTAELVEIVRAAAHTGERVLIGLDFSFGFPAWYLRDRGWRRADQAWQAFDPVTVDQLLAAPSAPFWGRGAVRTRPDMLVEPTQTPAFRETERQIAARHAVRPFSIFQLVGAGSVGAASLRGMATLHALREAGATLWPFAEESPDARATVLEVWPRLCAPAVNKSDPAARLAVLQGLQERHGVTGVMHTEVRRDVRASDDAFDALIAAHALWRGRNRPLTSRVPPDVAALEGAIWEPPV
jgi:hypothetical protein